MHNIRRVDHDTSRTHCWRVTVQRRKRLFRRDFSDGLHGGRQPALEAAQAYRDAVLQAHPGLSKPAYCAIRKKNNRSGVSGLMRVDRWEMSRGRRTRRLYWEAPWPIRNGRSRHKKFSILKYGEGRAYLKALAARQSALDVLAHQTFPSSGVPRPGNVQEDCKLGTSPDCLFRVLPQWNSRMTPFVLFFVVKSDSQGTAFLSKTGRFEGVLR